MELQEVCLVIIAVAVFPMAMRNTMAALGKLTPVLPWIAGAILLAALVMWVIPPEPTLTGISGTSVGVFYGVFAAPLFLIVTERLEDDGWSWSLVGTVALYAGMWLAASWLMTYFVVMDDNLLVILLGLTTVTFLVLPVAWLRLKWLERSPRH